jgi:hypothetical protein
MSCKWGKESCKNEDIKCHLCTSPEYHFVSSIKKKEPIIKAKITKRQGAKFEANNHIFNQETLSDVSSRMTPNSGAGKVKGDEEIRGIINIMEELKTHEKRNEGRLPGKESFTLQKAWLDKLETEAKEANKEFWYLKFAFKNEDLNHYVVVSAKMIMDMVKTMVEDRRRAKQVDYLIDIERKKAMLKEAEAATLFAENELLKAQIKELKFKIGEK